MQLRSVSTSFNDNKHRYLTEIISFIGERVPLFMFSLGTNGYLDSLRVFLYNLARLKPLTRDSSGCGYDIVVPLIETIKGVNKHASVVWNSCTKLGVIPEDTHRANDARTHS